MSLRHFDEFADVADHCTVCHKCENALPGRHRLRRRVDRDAQPAAPQGKKRFNPGTAASMFFLNATDPTTIKLATQADDRLGLPGAAPRATGSRGARASRRRRRGGRRRPSGGAPLKAQVIHFINKPMPGGLPKRTARALLDIEDDATRADHPRSGARDRASRRRCSISRAAARSGCSRRSGSRRRRCSATSARRPCCRRATSAAATRRRGAGQLDKGREDHHRQPRAVPPRRQHAQLPRHQDGDRLLRHLHATSCRSTSSRRSSPAAASSTSTSTCSRRACGSRASTGVRYMYHDPCHSPMKTYEPLKVVNALMGGAGRAERPLLRRVGHARRHAAGHRRRRCASARRRRCEQGAGAAARRRLRRRGQDPDLLPVVPAGTVALRRRRGHRAPTTSSSRSPGTCWATTGWPTTCAAANAGGIERVLV